MNKVFQRIFSALVVVAITISLFPALKVNAASSGTLSSGVKWELDDYGTLTFSPNDSGEGVISDCSFLCNDDVSMVVIEDGITEIEAEAFLDFRFLDIVSIPGSVKKIGDRAFCGCDSLFMVDIHIGVETIGHQAFMDCGSLRFIDFPMSVIEIGLGVLDGCSSLEWVSLPAGLYNSGMFYGISPEIRLRYHFNLSGGYASVNLYGSLIAGQEVHIVADVPEGKEFVEWEVKSASFSLTDAASAKTTFIMPDEDVEITAIYKDITNTVTFDSNGHGTAPSAQTVTYGEKVIKPSDLTETGYTFGGWYTDSDCTSAYEFDTAVKSDFTLYAKWTAESSNSGSVKPVANTYTVVTGGDGTWDGVSDYVVRVKSDDDDEHCIDRFLWAAVDGHELEVGKEAEITRGSTIVTIKSDYLKTLSAGTHSIVVNFTDNSITTTLTISSAPATNSGSSIPSTGEMQSPAMYIGLAMIVAAGALSVLVIRKRKEA